MSPEPIQIAPEHPKTVPKGSGSSPKVVRKVPEHPKTILEDPGMAENGPGTFRKFPDSTIGAQTPLALGGKAPQGGWPKFGGIPLKGGLRSSLGSIPLVGEFLLGVGVP